MDPVAEEKNEEEGWEEWAMDLVADTTRFSLRFEANERRVLRRGDSASTTPRR